MKISLSKSTDYNLIEQVLEDGIVVQHRGYHGDVMITPQAPIQSWSAKSLDLLGEQDFIALDDIEPEIVIIGTGKQHHMPGHRLMGFFQQRCIGLETMTTLAACRTYNLLAEDNRRVIAYLRFQADDPRSMIN